MDLSEDQTIGKEEMRKVPGGNLFSATQEMQEMQMPFNMDYLVLRNKISHENRQFTLVSNIMKVKHDTVKAAINNIRYIKPLRSLRRWDNGPYKD